MPREALDETKLLFKLCATLGVILVLSSGASPAQVKLTAAAVRQEFLKKLVEAAVERAQHVARYDPAYVGIPYPGGDVPADTVFALMK